MEVKINNNGEMLDATIEMVEGVMVVSPKKVKFEPKDGDVCKSTFCIYIFKRVDNTKAVVYHCCLNVDQDELSVKQSIGVGYVDEYQRYATEEEKKLLFDKLAEEGWEWKADTKELVKLKWKPMTGEWYYTPVICNTQFKDLKCEWSNDAMDVLYFGKGWVFRTKEECQEFCNRLNQAIEGVKP